LKFYSLKARDLATANVRLHDASLKNETVALNRERLHIARELHDSVGYSLTSILMQLRYAGEVARREPKRVATVVEEIESLTETAARGIREQVAHIREKEELERNWLSRAERLCDSFERVAGVRIHKQFLAQGVPDDAARVIYSVVQEGINNAVLHGNASYIDIVCEVDDDSGCLILRISDNGIGAEWVEPGFGLMGIQERVRAVNGLVEFQTAPGRGFDIGVDVPVR
jgi:signal transduction histidine kinase